MHGIDLNVLELVVDSDGNVLENPKFLRKALKKLAKAQRKLSRMAEHAKKAGRPLPECKNYQEQRQKVACLHRRIIRQREDYLFLYFSFFWSLPLPLFQVTRAGILFNIPKL